MNVTVDEKSVPVLQRLAKDAGIGEEIVQQLGNLGSTIAHGMFDFIHRFIDLAKTNPLWGAVLGVLIVDLLSHKVDWVHWTHEEQQWVQTDNQNNKTYLSFLQPIENFLAGSHVGQTLETVTVPGVITSTCALTILGLIISGWGIDAAGAIIGDITQITKITGSSQSASLMQPSVTTLVEAGATSPIALPSAARAGTPAGVA